MEERKEPPAFIKAKPRPMVGPGRVPEAELQAANEEVKAEQAQNNFVPPGRQLASERMKQLSASYETAKKHLSAFRLLADNVEKALTRRFGRLQEEEQAFGRTLDDTYKFLSDSQGLLRNLGDFNGEEDRTPAVEQGRREGAARAGQEADTGQPDGEASQEDGQ